MIGILGNQLPLNGLRLLLHSLTCLLYGKAPLPPPIDLIPDFLDEEELLSTPEQDIDEEDPLPVPVGKDSAALETALGAAGDDKLKTELERWDDDKLQNFSCYRHNIQYVS